MNDNTEPAELFQDPKYKHYITRCCLLNLPRQLQNGDWYWSPPPRGYVTCCHGFNVDPEWQQGTIWVPRLDQWLEMLLKEDMKAVEVEAREEGSEEVFYGSGWHRPRSKYGSYYSVGPCLCADEVLLELWLLATGKAPY